MDAFKELQYKANYSFIFEFLQDLQKKGLDKGNTKFAQEVQAVKDMLEQNWSQSIENCNEIRALNDVIREMEIFILEKD